MSVEIITKEDLGQFKSELLEDLLKVLQPNQPQVKQWLKSQDVRKLLNIVLFKDIEQHFRFLSSFAGEHVTQIISSDLLPGFHQQVMTSA